MNSVENAQRVMAFKANVVKACKARNMQVPTDDKISEYIDGGYSLKLDEFMKDYTEFEGVFRRPFETVLGELDDGELHLLWCAFIQEVGNDFGGYIYDLADEGESQYLADMLSNEVMLKVSVLVTSGDVRFIRLVGDVPQPVDIRKVIESHWSEIFGVLPNIITSIIEASVKSDFLEVKSMFEGRSFYVVRALLTPYITQVDEGNELFDFEFNNNVMTILNKDGKAVVSSDVDSHDGNGNWQSFNFQ